MYTMYKRNVRQHIFSKFSFDINKEKIIYFYLCKKWLSRKQKKLLTEETKFASYQAWEDYLFNRYGVYNSGALHEFSKALNLLLREAKKFDDYSKNLWIALISGGFSALFAIYISNVDNSSILLYGMLVLLFFLFIFLIEIYKNWGTDEVYFYKDVKAVIEKLIEGKENSSEQRASFSSRKMYVN